jgi:PAS domain S-box-containing protein
MAVKALVVDNNPVLLKAVSSILTKEGCEVQTAGTGLQALEILENYEPDIVFTDLVMPLVGGEQLCRILRHTKKHQDVFIVVLSAIILEDQERIIEDTNCDLCIAKGNLNEIRKHIREAINSFNQKQNCARPKKNLQDTRVPLGLKPSAVTKELLYEKQHLATILTNLDEGVIELSSQGKIVSANRAALSMFSSSEEMLIGAAFDAAIDWGQLQESIKQWIEGQLVARGMGRFEISEESPLMTGGRIITGSLLPVAEEGNVFGLCFLRDISRQFYAEQHTKEIDNAIRLAKKMDAMSCMAGGVAHDFNNLLTVICGNLEILSQYGKDQSSLERGKLIEQARKSALVAADLTRKISCFSNFGIFSRESVDFNQLVRKTVEDFFYDKHRNYKIYEIDDCLVYVDREEISQAIVNVLTNGLEASDGGKIEIRIGRSTFSNPKLMAGQYVSAGNYARVEIRDFGKGIDREQLLRIFDPYYSTKERGSAKGMGLGLTVVYATLRNHGGHVVVHSEPDIGTTVTLFLPLMQDGTAYGHPNAIAQTPCRYVLLIEPDKNMLEIGRIMLEHLGYSVAKAANRSEAIKELQRFIDNPHLPKPLIILDLSNVNGESAVETCLLLHRIDATLQIIAMSGTILDRVMDNCRQYGFVNTLQKPYSMDSLKHIIDTVYNV